MTLKAIFIFNLDRNVAVLLKKNQHTHLHIVHWINIPWVQWKKGCVGDMALMQQMNKFSYCCCKRKELCPVHLDVDIHVFIYIYVCH